jgi:nucleoside-triphosphatase THEP1
MTNPNELSEKWIKASIIGTIWAASEIVFGSFLHNLNIPFSGNVLTAIGLIILISISYKWKENGLFWRAGLICAIMKTFSPSAVIFGPMIAIFSEAVLMEISTRILGKTIVGFMTGSMLAISWNLFQKVLNLILFYGSNIVEVYKNLIKIAQNQLNIQLDIIWLPLIILLMIYCLIGIVTATIGIRIGRSVLRQSVDNTSDMAYPKAEKKYVGNAPEFNYSLIWLLADGVFIITSLYLLNYYSWIYWVISITSVITLWSFRYKRAMRQLSKPKFWIFFVIITMITTLIFNGIKSEGISWAQGLLIGIQMNFRAVLIIVGFSVLGTELYNPRIRKFFLKTSFKQLPLALELSFESLPTMIASIPNFKMILKNPVTVVSQMISQAEFRLTEVRRILSKKVIILTGGVGQGKTTLLEKVIENLEKQKIEVGGIYSPRIVKNKLTIGYDIVDIRSKKQELFLRISDDEGLEKIGRYRIFPEGLRFSTCALFTEKNRNAKVIIIDEVGLLELQNRGWADNIYQLLNGSDPHVLLSVRESLTDQVIHKWNIRESSVYNISDYNYLTICSLVTE